MKRIINRLFGCFVTLLLSAAMVNWLDELVRPADIDMALHAIDTFHEIPEDTLEVIGYGSSHMWRGMNPKVMYEKYGIGAYNYGCNWQHMNTTELFLKDSFLAQSPRVVLIETYMVNEVLQDVDLNGEIYYTRGIAEFEGKREYLKQCFGEDKDRYVSYYMPLAAFHDNWVHVNEESFKKQSRDINFLSTMGYLYTSEVSPVTIADPETFEQKELSAEAISVLDEIVSLCSRNHAAIIFYTAPWQGVFSYGDAMKAYAREKGCVYLNLFEYMDELALDCEKDFYDMGHLNDSGAVKVADFLGSYIVNNYEVTDMRNADGNIWENQWNE
ncbi:MAG: hypothetical protein MR936_17205 [Eubacterium sp.]|nr:hypothetical protein [Eubacterium sp.]